MSRTHRRTALFALPAALVLAFTPTTASAYPNPGHVTGDVVVHDPTMVRAPNGQYLLYSTGDGIQLRTSADRTAFGRSGSAFPARPAWWQQYSPTSDVWAPDISYHRGTYWMYYSVSTFGSNTSAIGLATSRTGQAGSWTDRGLVFATHSASDHNAIDPQLFVDDDGKWWLSLGSWWTGIKLIRLDPGTGKPHPTDTSLRSLASRPTGSKAVEAPYIVKHGGYYYLFAAYDICCAGTSSTYKIKVGRSTRVTGPYKDRAGVDLRNNGGTPVMETHGRYVGPGGQSLLRDTDGVLLVYHYYDAADNGTPKLGINRLGWQGGWPVAK
ncbi:arabinan endo-1,5-alpha-L-arabinosidase [Streptomyces sp. NPDC058657]|uniref:arabinan endo-1,5-alpha-L-arabinosidase n=1 Tax=unclassified Streptomyces TaxID=2593676 RepID=UPI00365CDF29